MAKIEKKTQPVTVEFQGATLEGVIHQGKNFVAMEAIAEGLGLAWNGPLQRDSLTRTDLKILSRLEAKNTVLIGRDYPYQYRKAILARFVSEERARLTVKIEA